MKKSMSLNVLISALFALTSCSSKIVKKERLDQLKTVAIIGLDLEQQKPVSAGDLISVALKQSHTNQMVAGVRVDSIHTKSVFEQVAEKISHKTGWKVMNLEEMKANKAYAQYFKEKDVDSVMRPMINERYDLYTTENVLDTFGADSLKEEGLKNLAKALRVDALITVKSVVSLNNSGMLASMVGKGEFHPSSQMFLRVLDGTNAEKIYFESVEGPELKEGEKNFIGMASEIKLNEMAKEATALSTDLAVKDL